MASFKKTLIERAYDNNDVLLKIDIIVNINNDGIFSTTLTPVDAALIESYGVILKKNRAGRRGYFSSYTLDNLCYQIKKIMRDCLNYKVISNTPVIRYFIGIYANYCINAKTGEIFPDATAKFIKADDGYIWREGTVTPAPWESKCFSIKIFCRPYMKRVIEYGNGKQHVLYDIRNEWETGSYMEWLNNLSVMRDISGDPIKEIEGTEENARFFVNIIKQICMINEKIGDIIKNNKIEELIQSTLKLDFKSQ